MGSAGVVEAVDIATQRGPGLRDAGIGPQVDLFVFDLTPEPFDEHVVPPGTLAILLMAISWAFSRSVKATDVNCEP